MPLPRGPVPPLSEKLTDKQSPTVAYVTDLEGDWEKFLSFLDNNPFVSLDTNNKLQVNENACFVFGGDAIDRGSCSRKLVRTLIEAKQRQPDQVVLLAGNRDINKLRLYRELNGIPPANAPQDVSRGDLLRWIFANTMGARTSFDFRKQELEAERGQVVSDDDVVESYLDDLAPMGDLRCYLKLCQLVHRVGSTLFVHGAVTDENLCLLPHTQTTTETIAEWQQQLNAWYTSQIQAFDEQRFSSTGEPLWQPIIAYQAPIPGDPKKKNQKSVVYGRSANSFGNPYLPSRQSILKLREEGISRIVLGHTPSGDSPSLLSDGEGFTQVMADNSYSNVRFGSQVFITERRVKTRGLAKLPDARFAEVQIDTDDHAHRNVGKRDLDSGNITKGLLETGEHLLFRYEENFRIVHEVVGEETLQQRRLVIPYKMPKVG